MQYIIIMIHRGRLRRRDCSRPLVYVRQEAASRIALVATPSIRGNLTVKRANGNACALSSQDNMESLKAYIQTDC